MVRALRRHVDDVYIVLENLYSVCRLTADNGLANARTERADCHANFVLQRCAQRVAHLLSQLLGGQDTHGHRCLSFGGLERGGHNDLLYHCFAVCLRVCCVLIARGDHHTNAQ